MGADILASCNGCNDQEGLCSRDDRAGELGVGRFVGQVFGAGEESEEGPPLLRDMIAYRATQHGVAGLQRVDHRALGNRAFYGESDLALYLRQSAEVSRERHAN
jgi:hypothetical protein